MTITLVDGGKDFQELEIREKNNSETVYCQTGIPKLKKCCLSRYLICKDGRVYGRVATEIVPAGVYNGYELEVKEDSILGKMLRYHIKKAQERV